HRFEASICAFKAAVCALLPKVSEKARNSASTEMISAIFLLLPPSCAACCACSAVSRFSCAPAIAAPSCRIHCRLNPSRAAAQGKLSARMGAPVNLQQLLGIDRRVDLRGRERGVAEQLLNGSEITPSREKMRGERMAQRMRRRGFGQAERAAQPRHGKLHDAW